RQPRTPQPEPRPHPVRLGDDAALHRLLPGGLRQRWKLLVGDEPRGEWGLGGEAPTQAGPETEGVGVVGRQGGIVGCPPVAVKRSRTHRGNSAAYRSSMLPATARSCAVFPAKPGRSEERR